MISQPPRRRASSLSSSSPPASSPLAHRLSTPLRLLAAALAIAAASAPGLGCALAVGIDKVSGSETDDFSQRCVDMTNAFRILNHLGTVERWIEIEPCAVKTAEDRSKNQFPMDDNDCRPDACSRKNGSIDEILTECLGDTTVLQRGQSSSKLACSSYRRDSDEGVVLFFYE